MILLLILVVSL